MNRRYLNGHYTSKLIEDSEQCYIGLELCFVEKGKSEPRARILYWDAGGQFYIETLGTDVSLQIIEEFIAEAKESIKTK